MEVLIAIIGVVGGSVGTFITGYITHKRKIKAERLAREEEQAAAATERLAREEEAAAERLAREEEAAAERLAREEEAAAERLAREEEFTKFFIDNLSRLLGEFPESNNTIDFFYHFLVYLGCYCRLEYRQFVDGYIKLNISDSATQDQINKTMAEIENLVRGDINIRVLGELIIKRKDRIFQDFYNNKEIYGLHHQSVGDSNTLREKNRKRVYDEGYKEISKIFENNPEKKILLKQKFKELSDILGPI